jgi:hypothetical protein
MHGKEWVKQRALYDLIVRPFVAAAVGAIGTIMADRWLGRADAGVWLRSGAVALERAGFVDAIPLAMVWPALAGIWGLSLYVGQRYYQ